MSRFPAAASILIPLSDGFSPAGFSADLSAPAAPQSLQTAFQQTAFGKPPANCTPAGRPLTAGRTGNLFRRQIAGSFSSMDFGNSCEWKALDGGTRAAEGTSSVQYAGNMPVCGTWGRSSAGVPATPYPHSAIAAMPGTHDGKRMPVPAGFHRQSACAGTPCCQRPVRTSFSLLHRT